MQNTSLQKTKTKKTPDSEGRSRSWRCSRHPVASGADSGSGRSLGAPVRSQDRSERGTSHQGSRFSRPACIHSPRDAAAPSARGVERSSPADGYATRLGTWQTPGRRPRLRALACVRLHSCRAAHGPRLPVLQGGRRDMERGGLSQDTSGKLGPQVGTQRLQPQARHIAGGQQNGPDRPTPRAKCEQLRGWGAKPTGLWSAPH